MHYLLRAAEMKAADSFTINRPNGTPSLVLMERAAEAVCKTVDTVCRDRAGSDREKSPILVLCGTGNNGGDGFAAAAILIQDGYPVDTVFIGTKEKMTEECRTEADRLTKFGGRIVSAIPKDRSYLCVIDSLFGIGLCRPIEGRYAELIRTVNALPAVRIAVDIASGVHADTGEILGTAFQADYTVTFAYGKPGQYLFPGCLYSGHVRVADIGITGDPEKEATYLRTLKKKDLPALLPKRAEDSHKGTFGTALIAAGSPGMAGAAYLSALAAYRSGAGLVRIYTPECNRTALQILLPEAVLFTWKEGESAGRVLTKAMKGADVIAAGPGLGTGTDARSFLYRILRDSRVPLVLDADALNLLAADQGLRETETSCPLILTPHIKEMSRLIGRSVAEIKKDREGAIRSLLRPNMTIVLKDSRTLIGSYPDSFCLNQYGSSALAKGGSGDVLTGITAGLLASGSTPRDAAELAVLLHSLAGVCLEKNCGNRGVLAHEIADAVPQLMK